jgi:hypothetical protein
MNTGYSYELWNGKAVVGHFNTFTPLYGKFLVIPSIPLLKQPYGKKIVEVCVPVTTRFVSDDGVDIVVRRVLDVRKKSKKQIEILKKGRL